MRKKELIERIAFLEKELAQQNDKYNKLRSKCWCLLDENASLRAVIFSIDYPPPQEIDGLYTIKIRASKVEELKKEMNGR